MKLFNRNISPKKRLKRMLKNFTIQQLEDFRGYPQVFQDIFQEQGLEPPELKDIMKAIERELNRRVFGEIVHVLRHKLHNKVVGKKGED